MIDKEKYFKFYSSCIPVRGDKRGVIYDLQRGNFFFIPNSFIELLNSNRKNKLLNIYKDYSGQEVVVDKLFHFLMDNELVFLTDDIERFPELNKKFEKPFLLDILFLEIDSLTKSKAELLKNIDSVGCTQIVFVTHGVSDIVIIDKLLKLLKNSKIQVINLVSKYDENFSRKLFELYVKYPRFRHVTFYEVKAKTNHENSNFKFSSKSLHDILLRRISSPNDMVLNQTAFLESLSHNLFFNRKGYVDNKGNVKNYYNSKKVFGNIERDDIKLIIKSESFRELWNITKDKIEICKSCEFRYVCPDNRIPKLENNTTYKHTSTCNYDTKTTLWN